MMPVDARNRGSILLLLVFVSFAAGISIAAHRYLERQRAAVETQVRHELSAIGEIKARQVAEWRKERLGDAATIRASAALMPELRRVLEQGGDPDAERRVRAWIESWFVHQDFANGILLDTNGRVRLTVGRETKLPSTTRNWPIRSCAAAASCSVTSIAIRDSPESILA